MGNACDIDVAIALLDDIIVTAEAGCDVDVFVELDNPIEIEIFNWPPVVDMLIERIAQVMEVGVEVFFRTTETHLQYKLKVGDWIDLIPLVDLKGDKGDAGIDGQEISIQKTTTHIQWRLGNGTWVNLVALADLKGDSGDDARLTTLIPVIADTLGACLALFRHNTILSIGIFTRNPDLLNQVNEAGNDIEALIDILNAY